MELDSEYDLRMKEWNIEFVKVKFLQNKMESSFDSKSVEVEELKTQLATCRMELVTSATTLSVTRQTLEQAQERLIDIQTDLREGSKALVTSTQRVADLEDEVRRLRSERTESSQRISDLEQEVRSLRSERVTDIAGVKAEAVAAFKESFEFRAIIHEKVEETRDHIYGIEILGLERQCADDGFIRGFFKGARVMQRRSGGDTGGLSPSQASEDPYPPSDEEDADDVVSGLQEGQTEDEVDPVDD